MNHQKQYINIAVVGCTNSCRSTFCEALSNRTQSEERLFEYHWEAIDEPEELMTMSMDVILQIVDCTDLDESMVLTPQLIDMHHKVVLAMYRYDELLSTRHSIDTERLGGLMGVKVVPMEKGFDNGIDNVLRQVEATFEESSDGHVHVDYGKDIEASIRLLRRKLQRDHFDIHQISKRYLCIRMLECPEMAFRHIDENQRLEIEVLAEQLRQRIERRLGVDPADVIHEARHGFVHGALEETLRHSEDDSDHTPLEKIDKVLTSRWLGFPILVLVLYLVFECTFTLGAYPQEWIQSGVDGLCSWLHCRVASGWLSSMLVDGVLQGVGAVLSFLPNIVILFFFISLMEDSGYMSRVAFLMDKIMHRVGLHGRSFIPMLVGFGCNVPAIMAARDIDNRKDRTLTMLMIPFMSCGARLPVYLLLVSAFFAKYKALVMMSLYLAGIVISILFAMVMKRTRYFRQRERDYVSELPAFRRPTLKATGLHIWERCADYLKKISTVILLASVIIWALEYFPHHEMATDGEVASKVEQQENSYLAAIGKWMAPAMEPLGFDWRMNVCILTGLPAKEAIVSTMGILWNADDGQSKERGTNTLALSLQSDPDFTATTAYAFMLFVLLYFPCIATVTTLGREIGWKWALFTVIHSLVLAWVVAFLVQVVF